MAKSAVSENNPESASLISFDEFVTQDSISATWANGMMVYLTSRGGLLPRTLLEWRRILYAYQVLS